MGTSIPNSQSLVIFEAVSVVEKIHGKSKSESREISEKPFFSTLKLRVFFQNFQQFFVEINFVIFRQKIGRDGENSKTNLGENSKIDFQWSKNSKKIERTWTFAENSEFIQKNSMRNKVPINFRKAENSCFQIEK